MDLLAFKDLYQGSIKRVLRNRNHYSITRIQYQILKNETDPSTGSIGQKNVTCLRIQTISIPYESLYIFFDKIWFFKTEPIPQFPYVFLSLLTHPIVLYLTSQNLLHNLSHLRNWFLFEVMRIANIQIHYLAEIELLWIFGQLLFDLLGLKRYESSDCILSLKSIGIKVSQSKLRKTNSIKS